MRLARSRDHRKEQRQKDKDVARGHLGREMPLLDSCVVHVPWRERTNKEQEKPVDDAECQHQHGAKQELPLERCNRKCPDHKGRGIGSDEEREAKAKQESADDTVTNDLEPWNFPAELNKADH